MNNPKYRMAEFTKYLVELKRFQKHSFYRFKEKTLGEKLGQVWEKTYESSFWIGTN